MVGPFMQGMLLMGIIYWYSKGLINLINDYYRGEFNRKLKSEITQNKIAEFELSQKYDLSDMDQLVNIEFNKEQTTNEEIFPNEKYSDLNQMSIINSNNICYSINKKKEFLDILLTIIYNYKRMYSLNNSTCWLHVEDTTFIYSNTNLYADISI